MIVNLVKSRGPQELTSGKQGGLGGGTQNINIQLYELKKKGNPSGWWVAVHRNSDWN